MNAKSQLSKRPSRRNRASRRRFNVASAAAVASGPSSLVNPDQRFAFNRRTVDLTCCLTVGGTLPVLINQPPGSSATPFVQFGVPVIEATIPGFPSTYVVPFNLALSLATLSQGGDVLAFFNEYQIRAARFEVQNLMGDSYSASSAIGGIVPEIITAIVPNSPPLFDTESVLAFPNTQRSVLTLARNHRVRFRPRLVVGVPGVSTPLIPNRDSDFWCSTDTTWFGCIGVVRNWPTITTPSTTIPVPLRFSCQVEIVGRRPH